MLYHDMIHLESLHFKYNEIHFLCPFYGTPQIPDSSPAHNKSHRL